MTPIRQSERIMNVFQLNSQVGMNFRLWPRPCENAEKTTPQNLGFDKDMKQFIDGVDHTQKMLFPRLFDDYFCFLRN